jgi:uncharacterized membrane protein
VSPWIAIIVVGVFAAHGVKHWLNARSAERRMRERYALLAKLAAEPNANTELVVKLIREDDAKEEERRLERQRRRRPEQIQSGLVLVAVGIGLAVFLSFLDTGGQPVWLIGLMLVLMGLVLSGFSYLSKDEPPTSP